MSTPSLDDAIEASHHALAAIINGDPSGYRALYAEGEDPTLGNPFGKTGHQYMTLVYQIDKDARRLLAIRPGRKAKTLMRCFRDIGPAAYGNIRFVCSNMWKAYL